MLTSALSPADTSNSPTPPTSPTNPLGGNELNGNDFITLLVAQLKNQDPTSPMDPTQFVTQLVQFNSLEQLMSINQELAPPNAPASGSGSGSGSSNPNPSATAAALPAPAKL